MAILYVHWNEFEAEQRAQALRAAGIQVRILWQQNIDEMRALRADPPEAVVIDLSRLPSQGQAFGIWLRNQKATRSVPLVFTSEIEDRLERVRQALPDAIFSNWDTVQQGLKLAMAVPNSAPVVPGVFDGYSGTPLVKKLGIKSGSSVALYQAPHGFASQLEGMPSGVMIQYTLEQPADILLLFVMSLAELADAFPQADRCMAQGGRLWILWPKKASRIQSDLSESNVRSFGLERNFVDYKISAIDRTWSGLCFARRK